MGNLIIIGILLLLTGMAALYIRKEKKKGAGCIGCPLCGCCTGKGCDSKKENEKEEYAVTNGLLTQS